MRARSLWFAGIAIGAATAAVAGITACVGDNAPTVVTGNDAATDDASSMSMTDGAVPAVDAGATDGSMATTNDAADAALTEPEILDQQGMLALWLEASPSNIVIDTGGVAVWKDRSKHHNDFSAISGRPVVDKNAVNGHDAVLFQDTHSNLRANDATSLQFANDELLIIGVARQGVSSADSYLFSKSVYGKCVGSCVYDEGLEVFINGQTVDAGGSGLTLDVRLRYDMAAPEDMTSVAEPALEDFKFHRIGVRRGTAGTALYRSVDSDPPAGATTTGFDVSEPDAGVSIGANPENNFGNFAFSFEIAELVIVHAPGAFVDDQMVADVQSYLKTKYGL